MNDKCPLLADMADNGHFYALVLLFRAGYQSVKVALIQSILNDAVLLKLALRKGFCNGSGDLSFVPQNLRIVELQKSVQLGGPICHGHGDMPSGLPGSVVQIHGDDFVQPDCLFPAHS